MLIGFLFSLIDCKLAEDRDCVHHHLTAARATPGTLQGLNEYLLNKYVSELLV